MKDTNEKIKNLMDHMLEIASTLGLSNESQERLHRFAAELDKKSNAVDVRDFFSACAPELGKEARSVAVISTSMPNSSGEAGVTVGIAGDLQDAGDNLGAIVVDACLALRDEDGCERQKAVGVGIVDRLTLIDIDDLDAFISLLEITRKHRTCTKH